MTIKAAPRSCPRDGGFMAADRDGDFVCINCGRSNFVPPQSKARLDFMSSMMAAYMRVDFVADAIPTDPDIVARYAEAFALDVQATEREAIHGNDIVTAKRNSAMAQKRAKGTVAKREGETLRRAAQKKLIARKYAAMRKPQADEVAIDNEFAPQFAKVAKGNVDWEFVFELMPNDRPD